MAKGHSTTEKVLVGTVAGASLPVLGCVVVAIAFVVIVASVAGSIFGWLFGGSAPQGQANSNQPPQGTIALWTPTPRPADCDITPTPVRVTVQPTVAPGTVTPPPPTPTAHAEFLPTLTACPLPNLQGTPDPNYPPAGGGAGIAYDIRQPCNISAATADDFLNLWPNEDGSPNPLHPYIAQIHAFGQRYGICEGYFYAWAAQESGECTTGISPAAIECVNILWTPGGNCVSHISAVGHDFCGYASWMDAAEAWFKLLATAYIPTGATTVDEIVKIYAPCSDNGGGNSVDCPFAQTYITHVEHWITANFYIDPGAGTSAEGPHGNPFGTGVAYTVTQGFGCTTFNLEPYSQVCADNSAGAITHFHSGIDISTDGDLNLNTPVRATLTGLVVFAGFTDDGFGNRVIVEAGEFKVIFPHLKRTLVTQGQHVGWQQMVGYEGSTGNSSGKHAHYQIWRNGTIIDPAPYLAKP